MTKIHCYTNRQPFGISHNQRLTPRDWDFGTTPTAFGVRFHSVAQLAECFEKHPTSFVWHQKQGRSAQEVAEIWWQKADEQSRERISARIEEARAYYQTRTTEKGIKL